VPRGTISIRENIDITHRAAVFHPIVSKTREIIYYLWSSFDPAPEKDALKDVGLHREIADFFSEYASRYLFLKRLSKKKERVIFE